MNDYHVDNYRMLAEMIVETAAIDYLEWYYAYHHLHKPKYKEEWIAKHISTKDPKLVEVEYKKYCLRVKKQMNSLDWFFKHEMGRLVELDAEDFYRRLKEKAKKGKKAYIYEIARKPL